MTQAQPVEKHVTALDARTHLGEILDEVRYRKIPHFVDRHGRPVAVLLDMETYQQLQLPAIYRQQTKEAVQKISTAYRPLKIILFGSTAVGEIQQGSDIDLLIIKETDERMTERIESVLKLLPADSHVEPHIFTPAEIMEGQQDLFLSEALKGRVLYEAV